MKEKRKWTMTFKKGYFVLILAVILVTAVTACFYCVQLFTHSIPHKTQILKYTAFSLFFLIVTSWSLSLALFSRYVYDGKVIRVWLGFLPVRKISLSGIYGILSYPLNEEIFLLYREKNKNLVHFLCLRYQDADAFCRQLTRDNPQIELEIHTREQEEDE